MDRREVFYIFLRYFILVVLAVPNLLIFYLVFTPLTIYPTYWLIDLFYGAVLNIGTTFPACHFIIQNLPFFEKLSSLICPNNSIFFKGYYANIIPACVAGAAYYLLLILNLTTPMESKKRAKSICFLFVSFLVLNLARILIFAALLTRGYKYFDLTHNAAWYFGSTILVIFIWFANVLLFKIKEVPVYTDIKSIHKDMTLKVNKTP